MRTRLLFISLFSLVVFFTMVSCKKDDSASKPVLTTTELTNITKTSAKTGGTITSSGGSDITARGICYSTLAEPTIDDSTAIDISGLNTFASNITGLTEGKTYYFRAYATNGVGTSYGQSVVFGTVKQSLSYGAAYINDIYYSLKNGVISTEPRAIWDIAFSVSTRSSSIIINESTGTTLKAFPSTWTWTSTIDTTGFHSWVSLRNSDTDWEIGAFNANASGHPNYGWGIYNSINHNIENTEGGALYIIKLADGSCKKIWIETKYSSLQKYSFRFANLDGSNEKIVSNMDISNSKANYVYYSLPNNTRLDREPDATTWDLLFTKWVDNGISYPVTGVFQNIGVKAINLTVSDPSTITYLDSDFLTNINTVGSSWKVNDPITRLYTIPSDKYYIVKDKTGRIYQIHFLTFSGSTLGDFSFNIKQLQ